MAAADEMKIRGVKFTMSDLARRLRISKTSLYDHFSSKNDLVHDILITAINDVQTQEQEICNNSNLSIVEKIQGLLKISPKVFGPINNPRLYTDLVHYYPDEWQLVSEFRQKQLNHLKCLIDEAIENNSIRPINVSVFKQIVTSTMNDLLNYQFLEESNMTSADALSAMTDIIVFGLRPYKE
jgi:AcrR family transcriptional regulator